MRLKLLLGLAASPAARELKFYKPHGQNPNQRGCEPSDHVRGVMYAEIDPRQPNQEKHYRRDDPDNDARASTLYAARKNRSETGEAATTRERLTTRETVCFRRCEIEKWNGTRTVKGELQRRV